MPGSAYSSYLATWHSFADAVAEAAPGAPLTGPDTGAYSPMTWTPDPDRGVSWTERFAADERGSGGLADITQHFYVGGGPGKTAARQAISNMLSPEWVHGTAVGTQPQGTTYTPYPWFYENHLAPVVAAGLPYRLTESNDYLGGVPGASDAFASALWALDYLHWWAAHAAGGVNFHNKQWLLHRHDRAGSGRARRRLRGHPQGLRHQGVHPGLGGAGQARGDRECGRRQPDRLRRRRGQLGLRHDHQQDPGSGGCGCGRDDRRARTRGRPGRR